MPLATDLIHPIDAVIRVGAVQLRTAERMVLIDNASVRLGARAFDVLIALIERRDRVVSKNELLDLVWPGLVVEENNLQVHISALRKLLGPQAIATVPGRGYQFTAALNVEPALAAAAGNAPQQTPNNLPKQRTRFFGRETALADCAGLLQGARLLTLTGIGGCGKTRLALQLAQHQLLAFPDGVWFVDLAPLQDARRVASAAAAALGVREEAGTPLIERLIAHLAARRVLIVLDNCEHVIDAAVELMDALLAGCADLTFVATSREAMGGAGEQIFPVSSLSLPATTDLDAIQDSEAVRLFIDRARLAVPDFEVNPGNAASIAEICRRLDGIALAIELAAARVKMLSVDEIRPRIADRFRLLTGGDRALPRHRTLQATLEWSYEHLSPKEQRLFRQLAAFAGGWTLAATAHVAGVSDEYEVLDLLTTLHDKSLLVVDRDNHAQPRYRMLETVRQYAHARLNESGDGDETRTRHLLHYVAMAEEASPQLRGPQQGAWMARLRLEQENLLAAHAWCRRAPGGARLAQRLTPVLLRYWVDSAQLERGYRLAQDVLELAGNQTGALVLRVTAILAWHMGRYDESLAYGERSLALARELADVEQTVAALQVLGNVLRVTGQTTRARAQFAEVCDLARALKNTRRLAEALNNLAELHRGSGDFVVAEACYLESIAIARAWSDPHETVVPLINLARLLIAAGTSERARAALLESLAIAESAGLKGQGEYLLEVSAGLAAALADHSSAARLHGAALARMSEAGTRREPVDEAFIAPLMARSREALGATAFDTAETSGQALSYEASMAELTQWLQRPA